MFDLKHWIVGIPQILIYKSSTINCLDSTPCWPSGSFRWRGCYQHLDHRRLLNACRTEYSRWSSSDILPRRFFVIKVGTPFDRQRWSSSVKRVRQTHRFLFFFYSKAKFFTTSMNFFFHFLIYLLCVLMMRQKSTNPILLTKISHFIYFEKSKWKYYDFYKN